ncbi:myelin protein P0 [Ambystoma mexicanum]|uniref:myelin protein P0 n=1 Tax=Ambystoma mexicanum TaxID=8296 RepID=UPI0037E75EE7
MASRGSLGTESAFLACIFLSLLVLSPTLAIDVYTAREVHGTVGSKVTLSCTFWSSEWISDDISVTWHFRPDGSRASQSIVHYAKGKSYIDEVGAFKDRLEFVGNPHKKDGSILIHNLVDTDNGTFTCDVKNLPDVVGTTSSVHLLVFEKVPMRAGVLVGIIVGGVLGVVILLLVLAYLIRYCWLQRQARLRRDLSALERGKLHKSGKDSKRSRQAPILYAMLDHSKSVKSASEKKAKGGLGDSRKDKK